MNPILAILLILGASALLTTAGIALLHFDVWNAFHGNPNAKRPTFKEWLKNLKRNDWEL